MMTLIRKIFWLALFVVSTLGFVTLFDHGYTTTKKFTDDAATEVSELRALIRPSPTPKDKSEEAFH
jgi:predicted secreted protein